MSNLVTRERDKYDELWSSLSAYSKSSPGELFLPVFESMRRDRGPVTVLDAGCGSGKGARMAAGSRSPIRCCQSASFRQAGPSSPNDTAVMSMSRAMLTQLPSGAGWLLSRRALAQRRPAPARSR